MIPKFRAWDKAHEVMRNVLLIDFISRSIICETEDDRNIKLYDITYELMQSTGIKDKNGVEIYEGDIIHHAEKPNPFFNSPFEIIQARTGEWILDNYRGGTVLAFSQPEELEVIGNIYENPELLEES